MRQITKTRGISNITKNPFAALLDNVPPFLADALLYLDGTIIEDTGSYYFIDKSGNSRDFLITGYDWSDRDVNGLPYKTAATISAPIADATLIAADVNNFLYDIGGTPNEIPVVSLFQDIDYENKLFVKHSGQVLDVITGVELHEPHVKDIVLYDTVKVGADLVECQSYFVVPVEDVAAVWVAKDGLDTNLGTKASPYLTIEKADTASIANTVCYIKTGQYTENVDINNIVLTKTGGTFLTDISGTQALRISLPNSTQSIGIIGRAASYTLAAYVNWVDNVTLNKAYISTISGGIAVRLFALGGIVKNSVIKSASGTAITLNGANGNFIFDSNYLQTDSGLTILVKDSGGAGSVNTIKNNVIKANPTGTNAYLLVFDDIDMVGIFNIFGNKFYSTGGTYGIYDKDPSTAVINITYNTFNLVVPPTSSVIRFFNANSGLDISNNTIIITESDGCTIIFLIGQSDKVIAYNNILVTALTGNDLGINLTSTGVVSENNLINNNRFKVIGGLTSIGIQIGSNNIDTSLGNCNDNIVYNNYIEGQNDAGQETHGILYGFSKGVVKYNFSTLSQYGLVSKYDKGDGSDVLYNIFLNNVMGLYLKGVDNSKVYGNTIINKAGSIGQRCLYLSSNGDVGSSDLPIEGSDIRNNIIINDNDTFLVQLGDALDLQSSTIDYNIYYSASAEPFKIGASTYTFAEWQAFGYDANSIFLTEAQFNALFTDYDNDDFSIPDDSIASGIFADLGLDYRLGLDSRTNWGSDTEVPSVVNRYQGDNFNCGAYVNDDTEYTYVEDFEGSLVEDFEEDLAIE